MPTASARRGKKAQEFQTVYLELDDLQTPLSPTPESFQIYQRSVGLESKISRLILSNSSPAYIAQLILEDISLIFPQGMAGCLLLFNEQAGEYHPLAMHNFQALSSQKTYTVEQFGIGKSALLRRAPILVKPFSDDRNRPVLRSGGSSSTWLVLPLISQAKTLGILIFSLPETTFSTKLVVSFLQRIADLLTVAILQHKYREAEVQKRQEAEIIRNLLAALTNSLEIGQVLGNILLYLAQIIHYDRAALYLFEDGGRYIVSAEDFTKPEHLRRTISLNHPVVKDLLNERRLILSKDVQNDPRFIDWPDLEFLRGWMVVPLLVGEKMVGFITLGDIKPGAYDADQAASFQVIADQMAQVIQRARTIEEAYRKAEELEMLSTISTALEREVATRTRHLSTLYEISAITSGPIDLNQILEQVLATTLAAMDTSIGTIHLVEEDKKWLRIKSTQNFPIDSLPRIEQIFLKEVFWKRILTGKGPMILPDLNEKDTPLKFLLSQGIKAFLGAPIKAGGKVLGLLSLYGDSVLDLTIGDVSLFTTIADHLGKVVEREKLYKQAEQAAVMEERQRLARELHDSVTQMLYGLTLYCGAGRRALKADNLKLIEQYLERIDHTSQQALKEMRLLVYELRPAVFQTVGLVGALNHRLEAVEKRLGIHVQLVVDGQISLDEAVEFDLYRIAEEALNNALKHSMATSIQVKIHSKGNRVVLTVSDNGIGFKYDKGKSSGGIGLLSMQERTAKLGGNILIKTAPGKGTIVRVTVRELDD
jgi:signal transduction histidine kinase